MLITLCCLAVISLRVQGHIWPLPFHCPANQYGTILPYTYEYNLRAILLQNEADKEYEIGQHMHSLKDRPTLET